MELTDETNFKAGTVEADGVLFNLMTIGEAAKNVPKEIQDLAPEVKWGKIMRFRDFVTHRLGHRTR
jgi:uncharacterized protein with HEPN domain